MILGSVWRGAYAHQRDGSVSPVIWFWYVSTILDWKPTFHLPHAEVNPCSCQHFLHLEIWRHAQRTWPWDTPGHKRAGEDTEQIFPQFEKSWHRHRCIWQILLCMFKCEPDGSEQWGLARCLIVCGGYRRGTLELIRVEAQAFCREVPNPSVTHHDTVI